MCAKRTLFYLHGRFCFIWLRIYVFSRPLLASPSLLTCQKTSRIKNLDRRLQKKYTAGRHNYCVTSYMKTSMNTKVNVTAHWKTYCSMFWTDILWFERSVPAKRTRRCRFWSSCDLSLYRTVERRVLPGEDNRKSFLVEGKTEEIWSLSSHLHPSAFLWKRKIRIDVEGITEGLGLKR
jgi:hypothetical protein